jgi:hypothetical protein
MIFFSSNAENFLGLDAPPSLETLKSFDLFQQLAKRDM